MKQYTIAILALITALCAIVFLFIVGGFAAVSELNKMEAIKNAKTSQELNDACAEYIVSPLRDVPFRCTK